MSFNRAGCKTFRSTSPPRQAHSTLRATSPRPLTKTLADREKARQRRERVYYLLKEHAGEHATEARQTPWIMQLIHALDDLVQEQLARSQEDQDDLMDSLNASTEQVAALEQKLETLQQHFSALEQHKASAEAEVAECREALDLAQEAAAAAGCDCATLQEAVDAIAREDSLARRRLALRAHALKENLVITHKLLHEQRRVVRQQDSQLGLLQRDIHAATPRAAPIEPPSPSTRCKHPLHKRKQETLRSLPTTNVGDPSSGGFASPNPPARPSADFGQTYGASTRNRVPAPLF